MLSSKDAIRVGPWNVSSLTVYEYLKSLEVCTSKDVITIVRDPSYGQYSILEYARRDRKEIIEISEALGSAVIQNIVTFKPTRLALYETVAFIENELSLGDGELAPTYELADHEMPSESRKYMELRG